MMDHYQCIDGTPSVYFNFQQSNMKTDRQQQYVPYQYSNTSNKNQYNCNQIKNKLEATITPLHKKQNNSNHHEISKKLDTQEFFDDFQNNFQIRFGDSPLKCQFSKHLNFNFQNDDSQKENICKIESNISWPNNNKQTDNIQNAQSIQNTKQKIKNKCQKNSRIQCQVRKRILFKKNQNLAQKGNTKKNNTKIINDQNLMIVTSNNWTGCQQKSRKNSGPYSHPIKAQQKKSQSTFHHIFTTHNGFRETLRSTTLDNWKKKHLSVKRKDFYQNNKRKSHNLFEKPFSLIR